MSFDADALAALKLGLLEAARVELVGTTEGEPNRACSIPGNQIAWDDCECGQLTVHHTLLQPFADFSATQKAAGLSTKCEMGWVVTLHLTILRCAPDSGNERPPTCASLGAAAAVQDEDAAAVLHGALCALAGHQWRFGGQVTVGAEGACSGTEASFLVVLPFCSEGC